MQVQHGREWDWSSLNFIPLQTLAVSATYLLIKDVPERSTLGRQSLVQTQEMGEQ